MNQHSRRPFFDTSMRRRVYRYFCPRRGFTLVELLVTMIITSIIFTVGWRFLDNTSNISRELSASSISLDEARSALSEISDDIQVAAVYGSPNSRVDPKVQPRSRNQTVGVVTGVYPYNGWQNNHIWEHAAGVPQQLGAAEPILAANPSAVFNGLVVLSAHSYPLAFESRLQSAPINTLIIPDSPRGLRRLANPNPMIVANQLPPGNPLDDPQWSSRILRILDPEGFKQFSPVESANTAASSIVVTVPFSPKGPGQTFGVDIATGVNDRLYETSALDMFWYHVRKDPNPTAPNNLQLVRERLCARRAIFDYQANPAGFSPQNYLAGGACGERETVVLANQVATFRVWFECGDPTGAVAINGLANTPVRNAVEANRNSCLQLNIAAPLQRVRIGHIRLSTHPKTERKEYTDRNFYVQNGELRAFDTNLDYPGASPVTTIQGDVFLRNFLYW